MDRQRVCQLANRFIKEAEADINFGLAEGPDPHHEYTVIVARLHGAEIRQTQLSPDRASVDSGVVFFDDGATRRDGLESPELQPLAASSTGL